MKHFEVSSVFMILLDKKVHEGGTTQSSGVQLLKYVTVCYQAEMATGKRLYDFPSEQEKGRIKDFRK